MIKMGSKEIYKEETTILDQSGSSRVTIPFYMAKLCALQPGTKAEIAAVEDQNGLHIIIRKKGKQPRLETEKEDL